MALLLIILETTDYHQCCQCRNLNVLEEKPKHIIIIICQFPFSEVFVHACQIYCYWTLFAGNMCVVRELSTEKKLDFYLLGWHLVVCLWIKHRAFKGWVNTVPLLHQSFYASIHPSIHPWAGKTLTLLRFWGCSHMCNNNMMLQEQTHSWHSSEFVCLCESLCQDRGEDNKQAKEVRKNSCQREKNKKRWTGILEMWKGKRTREAASRRWESGWLRGCEESREGVKKEKGGGGGEMWEEK